MAVALLDTVLGKLAEEGQKAYEILETYKGKDLEYKEYEPLYQCAYDCASKQNKKALSGVTASGHPLSLTLVYLRPQIQERGELQALSCGRWTLFRCLHRRIPSPHQPFLPVR